MIQFDKWTVKMRITINMDIQIYHSGIENMVRQWISTMNWRFELDFHDHGAGQFLFIVCVPELHFSLHNEYIP